MGLSIEEQREKIRQEKRQISQNALVKRQINKFYLKDYFVKGIYFLFLDNKVVYIGQSKGNVFLRVCTHFKDENKIFDSFTFRKYDISDAKLLKIEKDLIKEYRPIYNKIHNTKKRPKIIYGMNR